MGKGGGGKRRGERRLGEQERQGEERGWRSGKQEERRERFGTL